MNDRERVMCARHPEDVFGELTPDKAAACARLDFLAKGFRKSLHPDLGGDKEAFQRFEQLYAQAKEALDSGRYGRRETVDSVLITTRRHAYTVDQVLAQGVTAMIFHATYPDEDGTRHAVLKIVRKPADGALLAHEGRVLKDLLGVTDDDEREMSEVLAPYLPRYIEAFGYRREGKVRQGLAFMSVDGLVSLDDVARAYSDGVHPKDSAWMLRRLLLALGLAHGLGWAHGQVTPSHALIHPEKHGLVLCDWTRAKEADRDICRADAAAAIELIETITAMRLAPERFKRFVAGCKMYPHRLPDALTLRDEFTELIEDLWGERKFRPFAMPVAAAWHATSEHA